jgi:hypothetical protein
METVGWTGDEEDDDPTGRRPDPPAASPSETVEAGREPPGWIQRVRPIRALGLAGAAGGAVMAIGGLYKWLIVVFDPGIGPQGTLRISGTDLSNGQLAIGIGAALVLLHVVAWLARPSGFRLATATSSMVGGTLVAASTATFALRISALVGEDSRGHASVGQWLALAGACLALLAGAGELVALGRAQRAAAPEEPSTMGAAPDSGQALGAGWVEEPIAEVQPATELRPQGPSDWAPADDT